MRPLIVTGWMLDGGAARASLRLHAALRHAGVDAAFWSPAQEMGSPPGTISDPLWGWFRARGQLDYLSVRLAKSAAGGAPARPLFSPLTLPARWPSNLPAEAAAPASDLVHLHFMGKGDLRFSQLARIGLPLVWTMHDMWLITGGCHYDSGCGRYNTGCGRCPQLGSSQDHDLSAALWSRKRDTLAKLNLTVIAPSRWLADLAGASELLRGRRVHVIPNCIDLDAWAPRDRAGARQALGLPPDEVVIATGGFGLLRDPRKGGSFLPSIVHAVRRRVPSRRLRVLVMGNDRLDEAGFESVALTSTGHLRNDDRMRACYAASDVFLLPSLEENLPNMLMEAAACGVPSAAFSIGGNPDLIVDGETGVLARARDGEGLGERIAWLLEDQERHARIGREARRSAEARFSPAEVARLHRRVYAEILDPAGT